MVIGSGNAIQDALGVGVQPFVGDQPDASAFVSDGAVEKDVVRSIGGGTAAQAVRAMRASSPTIPKNRFMSILTCSPFPGAFR